MVNSSNVTWHPKRLLYTAFNGTYSIRYNETNVDIHSSVFAFNIWDIGLQFNTAVNLVYQLAK